MRRCPSQRCLNCPSLLGRVSERNEESQYSGLGATRIVSVIIPCSILDIGVPCHSIIMIEREPFFEGSALFSTCGSPAAWISSPILRSEIRESIVRLAGLSHCSCFLPLHIFAEHRRKISGIETFSAILQFGQGGRLHVRGKQRRVVPIDETPHQPLSLRLSSSSVMV